MKKLLLIITLCMGALQAHQPDNGPAKGEKETVNWEYKTIEMSTDVGGSPTFGYMHTLNIKKFDEKLNALGSEGWKLVALTSIATSQYGTRYIIATFKRPRQLSNL